DRKRRLFRELRELRRGGLDPAPSPDAGVPVAGGAPDLRGELVRLGARISPKRDGGVSGGRARQVRSVVDIESLEPPLRLELPELLPRPPLRGPPHHREQANHERDG